MRPKVWSTDASKQTAYSLEFFTYYVNACVCMCLKIWLPIDRDHVDLGTAAPIYTNGHRANRMASLAMDLTHTHTRRVSKRREHTKWMGTTQHNTLWPSCGLPFFPNPVHCLL